MLSRFLLFLSGAKPRAQAAETEARAVRPSTVSKLDQTQTRANSAEDPYHTAHGTTSEQPC